MRFTKAQVDETVRKRLDFLVVQVYATRKWNIFLFWSCVAANAVIVALSIVVCKLKGWL